MIHIREIPWGDPAAAFAIWSDDPYVAWLDSAGPSDPRSRYSYLCAEPFQVLEASGDRVTIDGLRVAGDPFQVLERELARWRLEPGQAPVPFAGGAVGFLGYELGRHLEQLSKRHKDDLNIPDMTVTFHDVVLAFDGYTRRCWVLSSGFPETALPARRIRSVTRAETVLRRLSSGALPTQNGDSSRNKVGWRAELPQQIYERRVGQILDYIRAGDIFQANFTMRHLASRPPGLRAADLYARLRKLSPAPFAAFLACGPRLTLASASPERFLRLDSGGYIEARPIKGTRRRYADPTTDADAARELASSAKDRAENLMIVDLMRNDIGRVAKIGSVSVPSLFSVESFASVHHLVSVIKGQLRHGLGPVDLLRATFPGGSITGAPKVRAMEIIDEMEVARRGPYCGAIAWIGFDGTMDSSIIIRTLVITPREIVAQAGGGIVADSDPTDEYEEQLVKIAPLLRALDGQGGENHP